MLVKRRINDPVPALILGCNKVATGVVRGLSKEGVPLVGIYHDRKDVVQFSRFISTRFLCPNPDLDEEGFISFLMDLRPHWHGSVLIPTSDEMLISVAKHKVRLSKYFKVAACDWTIIEKCIVKQNTYAIAERIGVPSPRTLVPTELKEAQEFAMEVGFPCLLKPSVGHIFTKLYGTKMDVVSDKEQLVENYQAMVEAGMGMMVQEFIPGADNRGANYNAFFTKGAPLVEVTARKVRSHPPKTGSPRLVLSKNIPAVIAPGRKLLSALSYDGFANVEFKKDSRDDTYKLMEINARPNLSTLLSVKAGVNFPYMIYKQALGDDVPRSNPDYKEGIYWIDTDCDLPDSIRFMRTERLSFKEFLRPYLSPHVSSLIALDDPLPFIKRCFDIVMILVHFILKKARAGLSRIQTVLTSR